MSERDQKKLVKAGFKLVRRALNDRLLVFQDLNDGWMSLEFSISKRHTCGCPRKEAMIKKSLTSQFLNEPKTILL